MRGAAGRTAAALVAAVALAACGGISGPRGARGEVQLRAEAADLARTVVVADAGAPLDEGGAFAASRSTIASASARPHGRADDRFLLALVPAGTAEPYLLVRVDDDEILATAR